LNKYELLPYVKLDNDEYSIPDALIAFVYNKIIENNKIDIIFYNRSIMTCEEFINYCKKPDNHFSFVVDTKKLQIVFVGWLNNIVDDAASIHFFCIDTYRPAMAQKILEFWKKMGLLLMGTVPESNKIVL